MVAIMYMKIVTPGAVPHLCLMDQFSTEPRTVCGCTITQLLIWKFIGSLEGDECPQCAFGVSHQKS